MRGEDLRDDRVKTDDAGVDAEAAHAADDRQALQVRRRPAERGHRCGRCQEHADRQRLHADLLRQQPEHGPADGAAHVRPDQHAGGRRRREAEIDDDLRHPLHDEIERRDVEKIRRRHDHGARDVLRGEDVRERPVARLRRDLRQPVDGGVADPGQRAIDTRQRVAGLLADQPVDRLGNEEEHHRNQDRRDPGAEVEDRPPIVALKQPRRNHAAEYRAERVADRHERHAEVPPPGVREFHRDGVDRRQHPADAQPGDDAPCRQAGQPAGRGGHHHARGHDGEASENRRPPSDPIGNTAQHRRADGHADELHRQHDAERATVDAPFGSDARRGEADREHVEPIEGVQGDGDGDNQHLLCGHRRVGERVPRIRVHGRRDATAVGCLLSITSGAHRPLPRCCSGGGHGSCRHHGVFEPKHDFGRIFTEVDEHREQGSLVERDEKRDVVEDCALGRTAARMAQDGGIDGVRISERRSAEFSAAFVAAHDEPAFAIIGDGGAASRVATSTLVARPGGAGFLMVSSNRRSTRTRRSSSLSKYSMTTA